jgi:dihydropteroate synthase
VTCLNLRILEWSTEEEARTAMADIGAMREGIALMAPKALLRPVKLEGVGFAAAMILKQEMLSLGGEAVLPGDIYLSRDREADLLLVGTLRHYRSLLQKLQSQPLPSLQALAEELAIGLERYAGRALGEMAFGGRRFVWGQRTYVMGVLNLTPDSFSGDGLVGEGDLVEKAAAQARRFAEGGADILDVGGESTRPGSKPVPAEMEMARVIPVIERLAQDVDLPISIDTYKARVAEAALDAGASLVNDVWGLRMDPDLGPLVAQRGIPVILMHNRSRPKDAAQSERLGGRYVGVEYQNLMADLIRELREAVEGALKAGVEWANIVVDPGIGFGKTVEQNLEILRRLGELRVLGRPILLGTSRKSVVGYTLDLPPEERVEGTGATVALGIARGADIVRVHDVAQMVRIASMADAIVR